MTNNNIYFIANWKMYGNLNSLNSVKKVIELSKKKKFKNTNIIYCPPYTLLNDFSKLTKKTRVKVGAQNCHESEFSGPFTGSVSPHMIASLGVKYIIIGHSENRSIGENNSTINKKIISSIKQKLKIIFCFGETLKQKKRNETNHVLKKQISEGLKNIKKIDNILFAYEPVWSIGTGVVPKISDLQIQMRILKKFISKKFKSKNPVLLYGGSVNQKNAILFKQINEIKGFLVGGASQNSNKFIDIIKKTII